MQATHEGAVVSNRSDQDLPATAIRRRMRHVRASLTPAFRRFTLRPRAGGICERLHRKTGGRKGAAGHSRTSKAATRVG